MAGLGSRKGASGATVLMLLAFVSIGGFMYWLSISAKSSSVQVVEGATEEPSTATGRALSMDEFRVDPPSFQGQEINLLDVPIVSVLGLRGFWTQLTQNSPYLVRIDPQLIADGLTVVVGERATISGSVHMMSDSVLDAWQADGSFTDDVQRFEAEFATSFFEASQVNAGSGR